MDFAFLEFGFTKQFSPKAEIRSKRINIVDFRKSFIGDRTPNIISYINGSLLKALWEVEQF